MPFDFDSDHSNVVVIKAVGIGGGGCNAVSRMVRSGIKSAEFLAINTDKQALGKCEATQKIQIGEKLTKGQGAGSMPERGQRAAEESRDEVAAALRGADMVFLTAGMGGGTGTGAAPIVAAVAKEMGILTVGIVTKPFIFEGTRRMQNAEIGIAELKDKVDSLIVVPNERLKYVSEQKITLANAFEVADDVLRQGVQSISDLINVTGLVNLDFADVTSAMKEAGYAHMGVGRASGKDKAVDAANMAISSPLLDTSIVGAKAVIINITSSPDIGLDEVELASNMISQAAHPDANIIWGAAFDETMNDEMRVTVIATGFPHDNQTPQHQPQQQTVSSRDNFAANVNNLFNTAPIPKITPTPATAPSYSAPSTSVKNSPQSKAQVKPDKNEKAQGDDDYFDIMNIFNRKK